MRLEHEDTTSPASCFYPLIENYFQFILIHKAKIRAKHSIGLPRKKVLPQQNNGEE